MKVVWFIARFQICCDSKFGSGCDSGSEEVLPSLYVAKMCHVWEGGDGSSLHGLRSLLLLQSFLLLSINFANEKSELK